MHARHSSTCLAPVLVALALASCGGGSDGDGAVPLFEPDGKPSLEARQPPPGTPATRSGLYASPSQYAWEALTVEPYTVLVDLDAAGSPQDAVAKALGDHAWANDTPGVAHYVRGGSPAQAAAVADALTAAGVPNVFLVTDAPVSAGKR